MHNAYYVKSFTSANSSVEKSLGWSGWRLRARFSPILRAKASQRRALFGLPAGVPPGNPAKARRWLAFARKMGENRALSRHPLNPRLFSTELLAEIGDLT